MNDNPKTMWEYIKNLYVEHHGMSPELVDYIAVFDIAKASCSGISNNDIAELFGIAREYVREVLIEFLNFSGWKLTLDISPLLLYNRVNGERELFTTSLMAIAHTIGRQNIEKAFDICQRFNTMRKEIDTYYG